MKFNKINRITKEYIETIQNYEVREWIIKYDELIEQYNCLISYVEKLEKKEIEELKEENFRLQNDKEWIMEDLFYILQTFYSDNEMFRGLGLLKSRVYRKIKVLQEQAEKDNKILREQIKQLKKEEE